MTGLKNWNQTAAAQTTDPASVIKLETIAPPITLESPVPDSILPLENIFPDSAYMVVDRKDNVGFVLPETLVRDYRHMLKVQLPLRDDLIEYYSRQTQTLKELNENLKSQIKMSTTGLDTSFSIINKLNLNLNDLEKIIQENDKIKELSLQKEKFYDEQIKSLKEQIVNLEEQKRLESEKYLACKENRQEFEKIAKGKKKWKTRATMLAATTSVLTFILIMK